MAGLKICWRFQRLEYFTKAMSKTQPIAAKEDSNPNGKKLFNIQNSSSSLNCTRGALFFSAFRVYKSLLTNQTYGQMPSCASVSKEAKPASRHRRLLVQRLPVAVSFKFIFL